MKRLTTNIHFFL